MYMNFFAGINMSHQKMTPNHKEQSSQVNNSSAFLSFFFSFLDFNHFICFQGTPYSIVL